MNPSAVLIDPDHLATTIDSGQDSAKCPQERNINRGKIFPVFDETMNLKRNAVCIESDDLTLIVDTGCGCDFRIRNINRTELSLAVKKPVLLLALG